MINIKVEYWKNMKFLIIFNQGGGKNESNDKHRIKLRMFDGEMIFNHVECEEKFYFVYNMNYNFT